MSESFQKKSSKIFLTIFIGFIAISFMFTGYESMRQTPDTIAKVDEYNIKVSEYQNERERQMNFYRQFYGEDSLPSSQLKQIRDASINNLIDRKLRIVAADKLGAIPSPEEVKQFIKDQPYFKSNDKFDLNRYKALLAANGFTPSDYENLIKNDLKTKMVSPLFEEYPLSQKYIDEMNKFKSQTYTMNLVTFDKNKLKKHVGVSKSEINKYLKDEKNKSNLETIFNQRKAGLDQKEEVQASHILLKIDDPKNDKKVFKKAKDLRKKLTTSNFRSMANKHTEDPSGKGKGGSLGWFGKGRMVPEFEKVAFNQKRGSISDIVKTQFGYHIIYVTGKKKERKAKFDDHKRSFARELIQQNKTKELDNLTKEIAGNVSKYLSSKNIKQLEKLEKRYGLTFLKNEKVNRLDGFSSQTKLNQTQSGEIFSQLDSNKVYNYQNGSSEIYLKIAKDKGPTIVKGNYDSHTNILKRKLNENLVKSLKENVSIKRYGSVINRLN